MVVVDNEDRENEGDLIIAADAMTTEKMAFLIRYTRYAGGARASETTRARHTHKELIRVGLQPSPTHRTLLSASSPRHTAPSHRALLLP